MINKWRDWLAAIALFAAFGWAGSDDYNYRCDQARKANKNETCKMAVGFRVWPQVGGYFGNQRNLGDGKN